MAAAERRRGRRDNGLDATDWRAVDDLDPRISEHILDLLGAQGIAAYVQPAVDVDPVTRSATLPSSPRDRLYVDRRHVPAARDSVRQFLAASGAARGGFDDPDADIDVAFAEIVAQLDDVAAHPPNGPAADPTRDPPRNGGVDPTADTTVDVPVDTTPDTAIDAAPDPIEPARRTGPVDGREVTERSLLDALDTFGADLPDEPAERFEPPPPPPLPRLSRQSFLGALAVVAGLFMVVGQPDFLPLDRDSTMLLGFATMLGGATALILRLRSGTDPDDTHRDDGARV